MSFFSGNNSLLAGISNIISIGSNTANFASCASWGSFTGNTTSVGTNGGPSAYGTYDMTGNIWEWNDLSGSDSSTKGIRGGSYNSSVELISSSRRLTISPWFNNVDVGIFGFRLVTFNNPLSLPNFINVEDINNTSDSVIANDGASNFGSVSYSYQISSYLVTVCEYAEFLNAVARTDSYNLYRSQMSSTRCGILRSGSSGNYIYTVSGGYGNKPVTWVSWLEAARYCNWLHNNKPNSGTQTSSTTETGAYTLNGITSGNAPARSNSASYYIPSENEWYKAAYYKSGTNNAGYWTYATQSNSTPTCVTANTSGDGPETSNYLCLFE